MLEEQELSRRGFLKATAMLAGAAGFTALWPSILQAAQGAAAARDAGAAFEVLADEDAADLVAIAAQIIPSDGSPGATEAGVVYFMDSALKTFMAGAKESIEAGLDALNAKAAAVQPAARFAQLPPAEQVKLLKTEEKSAFFGTVHFMTIAGMFALPVYGGNKG
ncbi:MAG: gluconate 2-dehydrogenase subunit 3 family protein [Gammaproteobacteria bacterium]